MDAEILSRIRSTGRLTEGELRYQLHSRGHPLAHTNELLLALAELEREGLIETELVITAVVA